MEWRGASLGPVRAFWEKTEESNQCGIESLWNRTNVVKFVFTMITIHINFFPHWLQSTKKLFHFGSIPQLFFSTLITIHKNYFPPWFDSSVKKLRNRTKVESDQGGIEPAPFFSVGIFSGRADWTREPIWEWRRQR